MAKLHDASIGTLQEFTRIFGTAGCTAELLHRLSHSPELVAHMLRDVNDLFQIGDDLVRACEPIWYDNMPKDDLAKVQLGKLPGSFPHGELLDQIERDQNKIPVSLRSSTLVFIRGINELATMITVYAFVYHSETGWRKYPANIRQNWELRDLRIIRVVTDPI
jgi:hypothetical protein